MDALARKSWLPAVALAFGRVMTTNGSLRGNPDPTGRQETFMRTLRIAALAWLVLALAGCGGRARKLIVGKWELADPTKKKVIASGYEFQEGGEVIATSEDSEG